MTTNIIPFDSKTLPAYLKEGPVINDDLTAHSGTGFPVISIKGKVFAVVRDGERKVIPNPKDPDSPATAIEMVIIKANKNTSKVFYAAGYTEGAADKPTCFSNDGIKPDPLVETPQATSCFTCPNNVWGSKVSESGKKVKACQDSVRIAVASPSLMNDPYLLRVPPATIKSLSEYGGYVAKRGVQYNQVLTKIKMDMEEPTPKLNFEALGILPDATYKQVLVMMESDLVKSIIGTAPGVGAPPPELPAPAEQAAKEVIEKAKEAKPVKAEKAKPVDPEVAIELDDLKFDD